MLSPGSGPLSRVVSIGHDPDFHERARAMVGCDAEVLSLAPGDPVPECELAIVECGAAADDVVARIRSASPSAAVLVLGPGCRPPRRLIWCPATDDLARMTYHQVKQLVGSILVPRYLETLLAGHEGNVTKAALAARLERETLHRLIRRHALRAADYRPPRG